VTDLESPGRVGPGPRARTPDVLARLLSLAASVRRGTAKLVVAGVAAAAVIGYALLRHGFPDQAGKAVLTVVALLAVAVPPLVLAAFWVVLGGLLELPERVRRLPIESRDHADELRSLAREARGPRGGWTSLPGEIWRLTRLTASSRELLTPYAPVLPFLSLRFLAAVVGATVAVGVADAAAIVVLIVLAVA
jgi:hypothetical protein